MIGLQSDILHFYRMGSALSTIHDYKMGFGPDVTKTSRKDWITMHAELSGLSIVEVERLWNRFQQLGCVDGVITEQFLRQSSSFKVISAIRPAF